MIDRYAGAAEMMEKRVKHELQNKLSAEYSECAQCKCVKIYTEKLPEHAMIETRVRCGVRTCIEDVKVAAPPVTWADGRFNPEYSDRFADMVNPSSFAPPPVVKKVFTKDMPRIETEGVW